MKSEKVKLHFFANLFGHQQFFYESLQRSFKVGRSQVNPLLLAHSCPIT